MNENKNHAGDFPTSDNGTDRNTSSDHSESELNEQLVPDGENDESTSDEDKPITFPELAPLPLNSLARNLFTFKTGRVIGEDDEISLTSALMYFMFDVKFFSPVLLYETLNCTTNYDTLKGLLHRLCKKGWLRRYDNKITKASNELPCVYYVTKDGYAEYGHKLGNTLPYQTKQGQDIHKKIVHDYGEVSDYFFMSRTPFVITSVRFEPVIVHDTLIMPEGKERLKGLYPDVVIDYKSTTITKTGGTIYFEHDTGSEGIKIAMAKLKLYNEHNIIPDFACKFRNKMFEQDAILFTIRRAYSERPACFNRTRLENLLKQIETVKLRGGTDIIGKLGSKDIDEKQRSVVRSLRKWTNGDCDNWNYDDLKAHIDSVRNRVSPYLRHYMRETQRAKAAARRNEMVEFLIQEYNKGNNSFYKTVFSRMLHGFPVGICAYNYIDRFFSTYFLEDYPDTMKWIKHVLEPYFGDMSSALERALEMDSNKADNKYLTMTNVFFSDKYKQYVSVEYLSCSLTSLIKLYVMLNSDYAFFNLYNMCFKMVYLVDSFEDACYIADIINPDLLKLGYNKLGPSDKFDSNKIASTQAKLTYSRCRLSRCDIVFLTIGGDHLFTISNDNKEVVVET